MSTYVLSPFEEVPMMNNKFFTFLQIFSPLYYSKFLFGLEKGNEQKHYGNIVDEEIINNISQSKAM